MTELSIDATDATDATDVPAAESREQAQLRELLVRYHQALANLQSIAAALLDASQPGAEPMAPEQARANRHAVGEALAAVEKGETFVRDLWRAFNVDRRMSPAGAPLPRAVKQDRRRKQRKGSTA
jgi:hypothetical protein